MLTPSDLQLPEKFGSWRPQQLETAAKAATTLKYAFLLDAPTGTGKSLIAAGAQRILEKNVAYLCTTKQLQDQLMSDFPYAKTIKGRGNYRCLKVPKMFPRITAEECTHSKANPCAYLGKCPYVLAKRAALGAPLAILNTAYFLSEVTYVGGFSKQAFLIIDEFDSVENQLMANIEVLITQKQLSRLNIPPPKFKTKFDSWVTWANMTLRELAPELDRLVRLSEEEDNWGGIDYDALKKKSQLTRLVAKLRFFVREVDDTWVWYPSEDRWSFKPTWVAKYATNALWQHADKVLGMSATILDPRQVAGNIGLVYNERAYQYLAMPSPFPKENRPVYYEPCADVTNKNMDFALPKLVKAVGKVMEDSPSEKILIHTVSYKVRDYLRANLPPNRLLTHATVDRAAVLDKFKLSNDPLVLLSPSMDRGVDLPDDACRVVVVAKCPYPDLGDPQVKKRVYASKDGNSWYAHKTISSIIQMSGRAVRSETDHAVTYILDAQFGKLYTEHNNMFPAWFKEAIVK